MPGRLILIAGKDPIRETGGHSSYVRAHARAAARLGFTPHLFGVAPAAEILPTDFGVLHRVRSPFRPFSQMMVVGHGPVLLAALRRTLREGLGRGSGPIVLHGFGVWGAIGVWLARWLRRRGAEGVPIVNSYTTYGHEMAGKIRGVGRPHGQIRQAWQRVEAAWVRLAVDPVEARGYRQSRLILVNYESVRQILRSQLGETAAIRHLPYTAESALLPPGPPAADPTAPGGLPLVVSVARHDPRKGLDVLLQALARLRAEGVPFRACLAGPGHLLTRHRHLAARLGLTDVAIPGFVADRAALLASAAIFVLPSLQEGSGSVAVIEALQAGRAIVASGVDGIPEDLTDGDDALLVPPGDPAALAGALGRLLADGARRRALEQRARHTFERRFDPDVFTRALGATYADLGLPPPRPAPAPS